MAVANDRNVVAKVLLGGLEKASEISRPAVMKHVIATRRRSPDATPAQIVKALERHFTSTVALSGGVSGAASAAPGVGTTAGVSLAIADAGGFAAVAGLYVLALSEIYGIPTEDLVRRRTLFLGIMAGDGAQATIGKVAGRTGPHWARATVRAVPPDALKAINKVLGKNFVTKYGTKQGILVLGKAVPFGFGAIIGAGGNAAFARFTVRSARRAFGPAPDEFPADLALDSQLAAEVLVDTDDLDLEDTIDAEVID